MALHYFLTINYYNEIKLRGDRQSLPRQSRFIGCFLENVHY